MRFIVAAVLFVGAMVCLITGIGEQTIWKSPEAHKISLQVDSKRALMVIEHSALTKFPGNPTITATGENQAQIGVGRNTDVAAWIGKNSYSLVTAKDSTKGHPLNTKDVPGYGTAANPHGSDLWRSDVSKPQTASMRVNVANQAAAIISSDGLAGAPTQLLISWPIPQDITQSRILIISGLVLLLISVITNWRAWYTMRRDRGPRRRIPRAPQGPRTRRRKSQIVVPGKGRRSVRNSKLAVSGLKVTGVGLAVAISLSGCSSIGANQSSSSPSPTANAAKLAPPVVTDKQAKRIIGRVAAAVANADAKHKVNLLLSRVDGPALAARASHYTLEAASNKVKALGGLNYAKFSLILPSATREWPRSVMAVVSGASKTDLPTMLVLQQNTPRSQYKLWYAIGMLPKVQTPEVPVTSVGAIPVDPSSVFLKLSPQSLPNAFGDLIDKGPTSIGAPLFDVTNDEFYKQVALSLANQQGNLNNGVIKVTHALGNPNVLSLSTANSGALVAVYLSDTYVIKPSKATQAVQVTGDEKLMLGAAGSTAGIRSVYGTELLFYVPAISSNDKIITLGATQVLISVRSL